MRHGLLFLWALVLGGSGAFLLDEVTPAATIAFLLSCYVIGSRLFRGARE